MTSLIPMEQQVMVELKACRREPTAEMIEAGQRIRGLYRWRIEAIWQAMYDAAPAVPVNAPAEGEGEVTITQEDRDAARQLVRDHIDAWGWGPLDEIEGLSEHKLAIDAAAGAFAAARQRHAAAMLAALSQQQPPAEGEDDVAVTQEDRDAAAEWLNSRAMDWRVITEIREGREDDHSLVQAFRNRRLRFSRPAPDQGTLEEVADLHRYYLRQHARAEALREAAALCRAWNGDTRDGDTVHIADAILALIDRKEG